MIFLSTHLWLVVIATNEGDSTKRSQFDSCR